MNFSWVPFYRELAGKVLEFEHRQDELLALDSRMKAQGFFPSKASELKAIDPFTFFLRLGSINSYHILQDAYAFLKSQLNLQSETPTGSEGLADVESGALRFHHGGSKTIINDLWHLARQAYQGAESIDESLFDRCSEYCVPDGDSSGIYRLIVGLSWMNPEEFLPFLNFSLEDDEESVGDERSPFRAYIDFLYETKRLNQKPFYELVFDNGYYLPDTPDFLDSPDSADIDDESPEPKPPIMHISPEVPLNKILYGPPGTGKTYSSIFRAVEIIDGSAPKDRASCQALFHELRAKGQIGFVTFHQSFSYEEFIEGLRPVIKDSEGSVNYEIRKGILKDMALAAVSQSLQRRQADRATFEQLWNRLLGKVEDETWLLPGIGTSQYKLTLTPSGNLTGENIKGTAQQPYNASRDKIERIWQELRDGPVATHALIIGILKVGSHSNLIGAVVEELKRIEKELPQSAIKSTEVDKSVDAARSFLKGSPDYRANFQKAPKFVLIIDEINRGNVSKIFGELITLLEDDKRIGESNELRLTLPTSGEEFALPPNLYILGTMNTADKSLAQLDVALRRRFEFEELAPRPDLCDKLPLLPEVLTRLNERLEWALDREHRLGHAYFMDVDSEEKFNMRFRSKVVPLLIEYFPHDFKTLRAVLGETSDGFLHEFKAPSGFNGPTKYRWWFETDRTHGFSAFARLKENFGIS